jgi:uncharacterized protein YjbJ (UPF0337 family)
MKSKSKDSTKGKIRQVKVNIHNDIWKIVKSRDLEAEGNGENIDGNVHEELGQVEMHVSYCHETAMVVRPEAGPLMLIDMK